MKNTRNTVTRIASIVLTFVMMLSLLCIVGTASAGAAAAPSHARFSLYCASPYFSKYGAASYEVYIQTRDDARSQKVYVHYNYMDGQAWRDAEAEFYTTLNDGSKIWKANFTSYNTQYCIKYVANGVTYWDNNNGRNYSSGTSIGSNAAITAQKLGYQYGGWNGFQINAVLHNYAYHKNVFVRYTTDNWNTYRDQALGYSSTNSDCTEVWTTYIGISDAECHSEGFRYAICYQVNGREYWANNFGQDYDRSYYIYR